MKRHTLAVMLIIFLFTVAGCGTTGKTQRSTISLNDLPKVSNYPKINVFPIEVDSKGIVLINVGIKEYGKFDEADKENIEWSLRDTIKNETHKKNFTTSKQFSLHIFLHKYIVAGSNNAGAVWAAVDWCIADKNNNVVFSETFYATKTTRFVGTIGGVKSSVHKAIVKRIAQSSLWYTSTGKISGSRVRNTYSTYEKAAETMPKSFQSWGVPINAGIPLWLPGTDPVQYDSKLGKIEQAVNWKAFLNEK